MRPYHPQHYRLGCAVRPRARGASCWGLAGGGRGGDMKMQGLTSGTFRSTTVHPTNTPKARQGCGCSVMRGV